MTPLKKLITGSTLGLLIPLFAPSAGAATVLLETFEGGTNVFNLPTYNYTANYTLANGLASPGFKYAHGGNPAGGNAVTFQTTFNGPTYNLATLGYDGIAIDSGALTLSLAAQFSTYESQNDFAVVTVQYLDSLNAAIGTPLAIGGPAFVAALSGGTGSRGWGEASLSGIIPTGARSFSISITEGKTPQGAYIDGYVDNVSVSVVPEPSACLLGLAGTVGLLVRRQRRSA
ncbi:hypothetical protein JIN84_20310 [Luteolibacter yonseiensis]|uniref:PEP-CTERM protein-sorting domain-containing protein n=1 Tax=Luteolibacter yonseiensis TaxID=1144680 RepID=A0A934R6M9_9BACT|nr:hypothetical protein [Luteolibacter yonseiensis]MBK1817977.1 hypothetical protein [Luteolibacter yonseiensis]